MFPRHLGKFFFPFLLLMKSGTHSSVGNLSVFCFPPVDCRISLFTHVDHCSENAGAASLQLPESPFRVSLSPWKTGFRFLFKQHQTEVFSFFKQKVNSNIWHIWIYLPLFFPLCLLLDNFSHSIFSQFLWKEAHSMFIFRVILEMSACPYTRVFSLFLSLVDG